jgi:polyhydroxybutyrate depolymerase
MGVRAGTPSTDDPSRPDPESCLPDRPVAVGAVHGEKDTVDPYGEGGQAYWGYSVPTAMKRWAELDGCRGEPTTTQLTDTLFLDAWPRCRGGASVELYRSTVGGHTWPGRQESSVPGLGEVDMSFSANEVIWTFLSRHRLDQRTSGVIRPSGGG